MSSLVLLLAMSPRLVAQDMHAGDPQPDPALAALGEHIHELDLRIGSATPGESADRLKVVRDVLLKELRSRVESEVSSDVDKAHPIGEGASLAGLATDLDETMLVRERALSAGATEEQVSVLRETIRLDKLRFRLQYGLDQHYAAMRVPDVVEHYLKTEAALPDDECKELVAQCDEMRQTRLTWLDDQIARYATLVEAHSHAAAALSEIAVAVLSKPAQRFRPAAIAKRLASRAGGLSGKQAESMLAAAKWLEGLVPECDRLRALNTRTEPDESPRPLIVNALFFRATQSPDGSVTLLQDNGPTATFANWNEMLESRPDVIYGLQHWVTMAAARAAEIPAAARGPLETHSRRRALTSIRALLSMRGEAMSVGGDVEDSVLKSVYAVRALAGRK
ncbi:MAG: hypothetical protein AB7K09_22065 [Planctomycetota bacterium]